MKKIEHKLNLPLDASKEEELRSVFPKSLAKFVGVPFFALVIPCIPPPILKLLLFSALNPPFLESGGDGK